MSSSCGSGDKAERVSGATGGWQLVGSRTLKLKQGELQLDITLQRDSLQVTKSYVVYPQSSIIREWVAFKNTGTAASEDRRAWIPQLRRPAPATHPRWTFCG